MPLRPDLPYADDPDAIAAERLAQMLRQGAAPVEAPPPPPRQRPGIAPPPMDMESLISGEPTSRAIVDALRGREALSEMGMGGGEWSRRAAAPVLAGARGRLGGLERISAAERANRLRLTMEEQKRAATEKAAAAAAAAKEDYFQRGEAGKERRARIIAGERVAERENKEREASDLDIDFLPQPGSVAPTMARKSDLQKQIGSSRQVLSQANEVLKILESSPSGALAGDDATRLSALATNLALNLKDVKGLGALSGPDMEILEKLVKNPAEIKSIFGDAAGYRSLKTIFESLRDNTRNDVINTVGAGYKPREGSLFAPSKTGGLSARERAAKKLEEIRNASR